MFEFLYAYTAATFVVFLILFRITETGYALAFNKPLYVHFYPVRQSTSVQERAFLETEFPFYRRLSPKRKRYFEHRVKCFLKTYPISGRDGLEVSNEMRLLIAGTYVMLTFGIKEYRINNFNKILLYPESYISASGGHHKGEFNPGMKAIVFSWADFLSGHQTDNDNVNLGLHEFSHALHFFSMAHYNRVGMSIFQDEFDNVIRFYDKDALFEQVDQTQYFRSYGFTNRFEFLAVVLEHFFETPDRFKSELPKLYGHVAAMINYREA